MSDLERVINQIQKEIQIDDQGRGFISIWGAARLADVSYGTLSEALKSGVRQKPSSLAEFLDRQGFDYIRQNSCGSEGIPDLALALILEYYGYESLERYRSEQAKAACRGFRAIGIRVWMQQIKGITKLAGVSQPAKLPDGLLKLVARIEKNGESLHTLHHRLMTDIRDLVEVVRTTYNQSAREEYFELLTRLNQQLERSLAVSQSERLIEQNKLDVGIIGCNQIAVSQTQRLIEQAFIMQSTQTGCLERYISKRKNKAGLVVEYPQINAATRDESIHENWYWRYKYSVKDPETGKWVARSKSVKLEKLGTVRTAIALDATLPTILRLIEER
jgi:hypothetical protein